ncbi:MAG: dihydrodipicolinate synthase family protein [SAR202 cluster bacterium]|nr:dihydrodipicolinate synthase family protein [SAR202 cluster bacterium]
MNRNELKKLILGPIATVPTPFDSEYHVDYGRMYDLTKWWVANGVVKGRAVIKVAAAMGEGFMLRDDEWPALLRTVVNAADGKAAIVHGLHYKDTLRTIEDAKRAQDLGAIGLQISPPIMSHPTQDDILRHYEAISKAIDIGIMIYHTHWWPGGRIEVDTFMKMADFEQVVAIKWGVPKDMKYEDMTKFAHIFNVIENGPNPVRCHKLGGRGFINETLAAYQPHDLNVWDLLEAKKYDEAQALWDSVTIKLYDYYTRHSNWRSNGEARVVKGLMKIMGQDVGDSRPPTLPLDDAELADLRNLVKSWGWPVKG